MDPLTMSAIAFGGGALMDIFGGGGKPQAQQMDTNRYGFQGAYQKYLQGENQRMKDEEQQRIMKMATGLVPGTASFRSGVSASGVAGQASAVMAQQQHNAQMAKATDTGTSAYQESAGRLDSQFLNLTGQNEQMRFEGDKFNTQMKQDSDQFNYKNDPIKNIGQGLMGVGANMGGKLYERWLKDRQNPFGSYVPGEDLGRGERVSDTNYWRYGSNHA